MHEMNSKCLPLLAHIFLPEYGRYDLCETVQCSLSLVTRGAAGGFLPGGTALGLGLLLGEAPPLQVRHIRVVHGPI